MSGCGKYVKEAKGELKQYKVLHMPCIWECSLVRPLWIKVLEFLSSWFGSEIPLSPKLCLLRDQSQMPNVSKCATFCYYCGSNDWVILSQWKTTEAPELNEWVNAMVETSYECLLSKVVTRRKQYLLGTGSELTLKWKINMNYINYININLLCDYETLDSCVWGYVCVTCFSFFLSRCIYLLFFLNVLESTSWI